MSRAQPRLRIFAGPNGSGKSTIKAVVEAEIGTELLGLYLNADDIEAEVRRSNLLDLAGYGVTTNGDEVLGYFRKSKLLAEKGLTDAALRLEFRDNKVIFDTVAMDSYFASVAVDFLRHKLLQAGIDFTFETVMSHPSKVEFLKLAQESGFRTYLYFVATEDPEINLSRVKNRVAEGGHDVRSEKTVDRYYRSLALLSQAVQYANRAYIFDNSSAEKVWVAEVTDNAILELKSDVMPHWFKTALWDKFGSEEEPA